jgi:hypothetical protein
MNKNEIIDQARAHWQRNLEEEQDPAAASFVMAGRNGFEDRGHAYEVARLFAEATGIICLAHVAEVPGAHGILSTEVSPRGRWTSATECIAMIDEALRAA